MVNMTIQTDLHALYIAMCNFARTTKDDELANRIMRVSNRVFYYGDPLETPLTREEVSIINDFMNGNYV